MKSKLISVVTVCLNAERTIETTIQSVLGQTYSNIEYIVKDGGSKDSTLTILSKYRDKITIVTKNDTGIFDAMNQAKEIANGDFLIFMGADDVFYNERTIEDVALSLSNCNSVYYGNVRLQSTGRIYDGEFNRWKWSYKNICHQSVFYPKSVYLRYDYEERFKTVSDLAYNLILLANGIKFEYIDLVVSKYNDISGISSVSNDNFFLKNRKKYIINAVGLVPYYYGLLARSIRHIRRYFYQSHKGI